MKTHETSRRGFYLAVINGLGALITAALALPAAAYLLIRPKTGAKNNFINVADLTQLQTGVPKEVVFQRKRLDGWRVVDQKNTAWVVKTDNQNVVAYTPQCTHLGCAYHYDEAQKNFLCPCHTSVFSIDGKVVSGPAPRPLDRYAVRIEGTKLLVGTDIQQS